MITPRATRLLRVGDLRSFQRTILAAIPQGQAARSTAVIVPSRSAAEALRRTMEDAALVERATAAILAPDLLTRSELYRRLHEGLPDAPPLLLEFEREVLLRLAAADAEAQGVAPPFRLRPGLLAAILAFYDEVRRRGGSLDRFDRSIRERLEASRETDRGAATLLEQTRFLASTYAAFERRVADSGRIDEHALRALLLSSMRPAAYRHVVIGVADQAADARGLWPADFDLLTRLHGVERLDVVATERLLAAGFHQRLHDALPGIEEERASGASPPPVLLVPDPPSGGEPQAFFLSRDREEELADAVRAVKARARNAANTAMPLDRTAIVFRRPLPYLYLARQVFGAANTPYQAMDALPLASEPFAAAMDLIFVALSEEGTRNSLVELLASPHWSFEAAAAGIPFTRPQLSAFDRILKDERYLGGWHRLHQLAEAATRMTKRPGREGERWRRAAPVFSVAVAIARDLDALGNAPSASAQLGSLLTFVRTKEKIPHAADPAHERHLRARAAVLGAVTALRDAHARYDDRPLPIPDLVGTLRRWIEGQTFAPRAGEGGVLLLDAEAAVFADVDAVRILGLVETEWPERTTPSIFYPASLLRDLGWAPEAERLAAARAAFQDLLTLAATQVAVSTFSLEDDALVQPSPFLEDVAASGLPIARVARASSRIFSHEALFDAPVASHAIAGVARKWLDLRLGRTSAGESRYRGTVGPQAPAVYAVSRVERYLDCPFKYFAGTVLQLDEEREDESGLTAQERGQLLHGVFEAFFHAWGEGGGVSITLDNLSEAVALFAQVAEEKLLEVPEGDRALERTYLLGSAAAPGLAERAFAFEIEQGIPVVERLIEHAFEGTFQFQGSAGPRGVRLRGKADRIDLLADGTLRIVDYKLGRAPKPGRALQLPIYGVCAQQDLDGRLGQHWAIGKAGYVAFREKNAFVELGGARGGNLGTALQEGQERFLAALDRIEAGEYPADPEEAWTCTRCGFPHVCRKDYVGDE